MIQFIKQHNAFLIEGKGYSYAMFVNSRGMLQQLYYGTPISKNDLAGLIAAHGVPAQPRNDINFDMHTDYMPSECSSFGRGDFRPSTVITQRADGDYMSRFKYISHTITNGAKPIDGMPYSRKADQVLSVVLKDDFSNTQVTLNYSVNNNSAVLVRNLEIHNAGNQPMDVKRAYSFCVDLPDVGEYSAMRLSGTWAKERQPDVTKLLDGTLRIESTVGYSSHKMNPFLAILVDDCAETHGDCYGFNLLYSGNFALNAEICSHKRLRVTGGINENMFSWHLDGGETFVTPQVAMCYSAQGIGEMSREYHNFFRDCIINPNYVHKRRPIVVNNWEATYFDFDNAKLFDIIDAAKDTGIDTFVLDDGWFGKRDSDTSGLGDWFVNETKLNGGLKAVIDRCKQNGLKFGLWFEPEMVSEDSDLFRTHPDWALTKADVEPCRCRNQLILDFSKPQVVDYVFNVIAKILAENDISYVKWDKNREMTEYYSNGLPADRQGELNHRYTLGFYNLSERLTTAFPNVFFEGCAGGGGRFDGGALFYFPQIWTSDDTDGLERTKIQWGTSICYPLSSMSCHVSACPNHQTMRITPFATRGAIASLGATGYELDLTKLTADELHQVTEQIQNYKQIDQLVLTGDMYRIANPFTTNYFCEMVVSKDKTQAYVVGERFRGDPCDHDRVVKLRGLDENKTYFIKELNVTLSGKALMGVGLLYPRLADCESWLWHISETKNK